MLDSNVIGYDYLVNRNTADCVWIECKYMCSVKLFEIQQKSDKMPSQFQLIISFQQFVGETMQCRSDSWGARAKDRRHSLCSEEKHKVKAAYILAERI